VPAPCGSRPPTGEWSGRVLGGAAVRAAYGGNLNVVWLPPTVAPKDAVEYLTEPASHPGHQFNDDPFSSSSSQPGSPPPAAWRYWTGG
jgi:hypothetical protein